jgi:hypothetical protein
MMKKADQLRAMANDKRRQAAAAWNPHIVRQCLELAKSYERRAKLVEQQGAGYDDDLEHGINPPQWPRMRSLRGDRSQQHGRAA